MTTKTAAAIGDGQLQLPDSIWRPAIHKQQSKFDNLIWRPAGRERSAAAATGTRRGYTRHILLIAIIIGLTALWAAADYWTAEPASAPASYVGRQQCVDCHREQSDAWMGSHHDHAMELASDDSVRADFDNVQLTQHGVTTVMKRDGDRFLTVTEGPDGELTEYEVKYTFGWEPLQQYMAELEPAATDGTEIGKVQVLRWSWDTQQQKWFYLEPPDVAERLLPGDPLHWTGYGQNWNHMCAECHSTDLQKNYSLEDLAYHTTLSEINVSCEACHGPGSLHVKLAKASSLFWDRRHGKGLQTNLKAEKNLPQIHACAPCHARRQRCSGEFLHGDHFADHYSVQLLTPEMYYPDGQIRDEVYVYGSFMQSKMFEKDVRCTDCHNPHTAQVKFADNRLCTSCHQHPAAKYDSPAHHHHEVGSSGAACIECHMPATPYMDVDLRRDHRMGVPRPDISLRFQTPNACTGCHLQDAQLDHTVTDSLNYYADWLEAARQGNQKVADELARLDAWAAQATARWYPKSAEDLELRCVEAFYAAWQGEETAAQQIMELADDRRLSPMVRGSAVALLGDYRSPQAEQIATRSLRDRDPIVRAAGVEYFTFGDPADRLKLLKPLLADPIRQVRTATAQALVSIPEQAMLGEARQHFEDALAEHRAALVVDQDLAGTHLAQALLAEQQQRHAEAVGYYKDAIRVQPTVAGARSNLAVLLERMNQPERARRLREAELPLLERDAGLAPNNSALQYRLGLACYLAGRMDAAEEAVARARELDPDEPQIGLFLALFYERGQRFEEALQLTRELIRQHPDDPRFAELRQRLEQAVQAK